MSSDYSDNLNRKCGLARYLPITERIVLGAGVCRLEMNGNGHEIPPAFAHTTCFSRAEACSVGRTAGQAVGNTVGVLVNDDAGIEGAVPLWS